jgi:cyclopropane fatty-acyl-phospholipid synthase-like methyltransferase
MHNKSDSQKQEVKVKGYFEEIARTFDSYYRKEAETGGLIGRIAHVIFRKPAMACRFQATFDFLGDLTGKRILDVGCGSGIYGIEIAKRGGRADGIDVSQAMVELAQKNAEKAGVSERCRFFLKDLWEFEPRGALYAAGIAIGLFDYIPPAKQKDYLVKLLTFVSEEVIATFPKKWVPATLFRKIWFMQKKLDVYFFTKAGIRKLTPSENINVTYTNCGSVWTIRFKKN